MWNVKGRVYNVEPEAECTHRGAAECRVRSVKWKVWIVERGV